MALAERDDALTGFSTARHTDTGLFYHHQRKQSLAEEGHKPVLKRTHLAFPFLTNSLQSFHA